MNGKDALFYDGGCGLCHRAISFILKRGSKGENFRFAPLGGETFQQRLTSAQREGVPDSLVILTASGDVLIRSRAVLHILQALGGGWQVLGWLGHILPRWLADASYDCLARVRGRLFAKPGTACPVVSNEQRMRFDP